MISFGPALLNVDVKPLEKLLSSVAPAPSLVVKSTLGCGALMPSPKSGTDCG